MANKLPTAAQLDEFILSKSSTQGWRPNDTDKDMIIAVRDAMQDSEHLPRLLEGIHKIVGHKGQAHLAAMVAELMFEAGWYARGKAEEHEQHETSAA